MSPEDAVYRATEIQMPGSSELSVYQVPTGRWLMITDLYHVTSNAVSLFLVDPSGGETPFAVESAFWNNEQTYRSVVGIPIEPGTEIRARNLAGADLPLVYRLTGYLVDDMP